MVLVVLFHCQWDDVLYPCPPGTSFVLVVVWFLERGSARGPKKRERSKRESLKIKHGWRLNLYIKDKLLCKVHTKGTKRPWSRWVSLGKSSNEILFIRDSLYLRRQTGLILTKMNLGLLTSVITDRLTRLGYG